MRAAYVTTYDGQDIRNWSGIAYHMAQALRDQSISLEYVGSLTEKHALLLKAKKHVWRALTGQRRLPDRDPVVLKDYARQISARLSSLDVDLVFSPGTLAISHLKCRQPIAFWTDGTFAGMLDFYPDLTRLSKKSIADGMAAEQAALDRASLAIYSSDWAARSAIEHYHADPAKVKIVPFGANLECSLTESEVRAQIDLRPADHCNLLFLAVDWVRKRGDLALEVARLLNARGLRTELTVVGCRPPRVSALPGFVHCLGFVSKSTPEGRRQIRELLTGAHFMILPSLADCTPIAFSEANGFGLPCLSSDVGGIPTLIREDINGRTFPVAAGPEHYADYIQTVLADPVRYRQFALSSFHEYETRLNWRSSGAKVNHMLQEILLP